MTKAKRKGWLCEAERIEKAFEALESRLNNANFINKLDFSSFRLGWRCATGDLDPSGKPNPKVNGRG